MCIGFFHFLRAHWERGPFPEGGSVSLALFYPARIYSSIPPTGGPAAQPRAPLQVHVADLRTLPSGGGKARPSGLHSLLPNAAQAKIGWLLEWARLTSPGPNN